MYNAIGQVHETNVHSRTDGKFLQSIDYKYNERGWLTHINNPYGYSIELCDEYQNISPSLITFDPNAVVTDYTLERIVISSVFGYNAAGDTITQIKFNDFKVIQYNITQSRQSNGTGLGAVATTPETISFLNSLSTNPIVLDMSGTSLNAGYSVVEVIDEALTALDNDLLSRPETTMATANYVKSNLMVFLEKSYKDLFHSSEDVDLWALNLKYGDVTNRIGSTEAHYNGNITEAYWRSADIDAIQGYSYEYDDLNRLVAANYAESECGLNFNLNIDNHSASYAYDLNGNFENILRIGKQDVAGDVFGIIDDLSFQYDANDVNKLIAVDEYSAQDGINDFQIDIPVSQSHAYEYDANGNLTKDKYRAIDITYYEHMNLPSRIDFLGGEYILFVYTAASELVSRNVYDAAGNLTISNKYNQGAQLKDGILDFISLDATSRVKPVLTQSSPNPSGNEFMYEHFYNDHLGNLRLAYADLDEDESVDPTTEVLQVTDYYPFGLEHIPFGSLVGQKNKYMYNGKEMNDELGLDWYNYGARMYDASLGRFMAVDPLAEKYNFQSPYLYAFNNPIRFTDYLGMGGEDEVKRHKLDETYVKYELIDDEKNIHRATHIHYTADVTVTTSGGEFNPTVERETESKTVTTTSTIDGEGNIVSSEQTVTEEVTNTTITGGTGGASIVTDTEVVSSETNENYDLSDNPQAEAFANNVAIQVKANNDWNPFNGSVSNFGVDEVGIIVGAAGAAKIPGLTAVSNRALGAAAGQYAGNKYRENMDHSGKSITYSVDKSGNVRKLHKSTPGWKL